MNEPAAAAPPPTPAVLEGFQFPAHARAPVFARAQAVLRRAAPGLLRQYAMPIQENVRRAADAEPAALPLAETPPVRRWTAAAARRLAAAAPRRRRTVDVLLCGVWRWERPQQNRMWMRLVAGLLAQGKSVLCLAYHGGARHTQIRRLARQYPAGRLDVLDVRGRRGRLAERFGWHMARERARHDLAATRAALRPHGMRVGAEARSGFTWNAARTLDWEAWAPHIAFRRAVVFCHWLPLCNAVVRTARERGCPVAAFQQGVVSHSIDVPVRADTLVTFGRASARLLRRMDAAATSSEAPGEASGRDEAARPRFLPGGSLFDPVLAPRDTFARRTVLLFDQSVTWALDYYGFGPQQAALERLARRLLAEETPLRRLVIRLHPAGGQRARYEALAEDFPARVVLSEAKEQPLTADLRRASVALGVFSGALATAAACGLPPLFVRAPGGYATPDLDCFAPQHAGEDAAFSRLTRLLGDERAYRSAREDALDAARAYYAGGEECRFAPPFLEKLLGAP